MREMDNCIKFLNKSVEKVAYFYIYEGKTYFNISE